MISPRISLLFSALLFALPGTGHAAASDLASELVYTNAGIDAAQSDFQGPTASGGAIRLQDFLIRGDLWTPSSLSFLRGHVSGAVEAPAPVLQQVSYQRLVRAGNLEDRAALLSEEMTNLALRLSALPVNGTATAATETIQGQSLDGLALNAKQTFTVIDLDANAIPDNLFLSAAPGANLLVRVHGAHVSLSNRGFFLLGATTASQISFFFPEASSLEIVQGGGATDAGGKALGIPASLLAPCATLTLESVLVTGQIFADRLVGKPGPAGQVNFGQSELFREVLSSAACGASCPGK